MGSSAPEIPEVVKQRYQNEKRAEVRREAAQEAAAFIRSQARWTEDDVHTLLGYLQKDWYGGKLHRNRFSPGLVGQHEKWLVETMDSLSTWLGAVREAAAKAIDDETAKRLLADYWKAGIKNSFVFPTAVLAAFGPDKFIISTKPTTVAMNQLVQGTSFSRKKDPDEYMKLCRAVRSLCDDNDWPLCLTDAALHLPKTESKTSVQTSSSGAFPGYTGETVEFLRELPRHTEDAPWHQRNKERYKKVLRDPTIALARDIGRRYIAALDQDVAASKRPTSILKKNDFGGNAHHSHYWFALFDPAAKKKTESVQLFGIYATRQESIRYGLGVGHYARKYHDRFIGVLRSQPNEIADYLGSLPDGMRVRLEFKDKTNEVKSLGDLAVALRNGALDGFLVDDGKLRSLDIERHIASLDPLVERGHRLVDDIGSTFVALWPLFEAARTGTFQTTLAEDDGQKVASADEIDEEGPDSLADLSKETSLPESFLEEMEEALLAKGQLVLVGPPGTSKTYIAEQFAKYFVRYEPGGRPQGDYQLIYVHASWAYEDFFEGVRPKLGVTGLEFDHHRGAFLSWVEDTVKKGPPEARYVLVLDEINRCDTAAVLGELLQLMEYRSQSVQLLSGRSFSLPPQVYIIGTMNSADRSIGRMDLALRRRFLFLDLLPDPDILQSWLEAIDGRNPCKFSAEALRECNSWLAKTHGILRDQQIGHALFMPSTSTDGDGALSAEMIRRVVRYSVVPYVRELLLERGRDPEAALKQVEGFFDSYWTDALDEDE